MNDNWPNAPDLAEVVGKIGLHQHLCLIYATQQEQFSAAIPFLKIGLERGEKCIYVADAKTTAALMNAMRTEGIDVDAAIRQGNLAITNGFPLPGNFVPDGMVNFLSESAQAARSAGYSALRVLGEMTWVSGTEPRPERLIEFEAKVNDLLRDYHFLGVCQYDRRRFPPEVLLEILRTHPTVVYDAFVCENPYYVPPDEYLNPNHHEREIERMLARMREDTATKEKLRQSDQEQRHFAAQFERERTRLVEAQEVANIGSWEAELESLNVIWSEQTHRIFETDPSRFEPTRPKFREFVHPEDRARVDAAFVASLDKRAPCAVEYRIVMPDGRVKILEERWKAFHDEEGKPLRVAGICRDVTERVRAEEKLRRLSGMLLRVQDEERRKIARDLHDSTGQNLVALATMLGQLRGYIPSKERKSRRLLSECKALVDRCIGEVRTLSYVLHPPALDQAGLIGAIREYLRGFIRRSGIHVELEFSPRVGRTTREVELALFRVVQESLTNIQRHSGSQYAKIRIDRDSNLTLEISDYRSGDSGTLSRHTGRSAFQFGVGIRSMQERVNLIGGRLEIDTTDHGTVVRVTVPLGDGYEKTAHSAS
jgi:signal transduction histidine kinase